MSEANERQFDIHGDERAKKIEEIKQKHSNMEREVKN